MSKANLWTTMLKELGDISSWVGEALTGTGKFSEDRFNKQRSKELIKLAKKEPSKIKTFDTISKKVIFHTKVPKEKEQKFFNRHMEEKNDRRKEGK